MYMDYEPVFPSYINGRANKSAFTQQRQNVNTYSEMPEVPFGASKNHMRQNYTTCQITQGSTRHSGNAKFHDSFPPCKIYRWISKSPPKPQCLSVTQTIS